MNNLISELARAEHSARLAEAERGRRARLTAAARRCQRRAARLSLKAERVSRRADLAAHRARLALGRLI